MRGARLLGAPSVHGELAYLLVGLLATVVYFATGAAGVALIARARDPEEEPSV
ncbi:MAG: hypothetical protein ABI950_00650 [Solirubrobacteraceae bacterium]